MSKVCSYTAVPTDTDTVASNEVAAEKEEQRNRRFKCLRVACIFLFVWFICGAIFDDDDHHHHHHGHHAMKHYMRHYHSDKLPTKLSGGGRDWLVNAVNGTVHAKHNPTLVLGVDTTSPLVLVKRSSPHQLNFGPPPKNAETFLPFQDSLHHLGVVVGDKQHVGEYHVRSTKLSPTMSSSEALVSYQEDNFIVLENSNKMVMDVEDWKLREFQPVKFVEGPHWDSFASTGGGRDFVWEKSGILSLKLNPDLVLGRALPNLILVDQDSKHKIVLQHSQELANGGKAVELTLVGGGAIGQRYQETREYGPWRYIESQVGDTEKNAIVATYDGNFILANNGLALDVSFWELEQGTSVNFVGGNDYVDQSEQTQSSLPMKPKSLLRESYATGSSSSDTSSSSSDSSLSSETSNINMMGEENVPDNEVYEDEDFVMEKEAIDDSQEELDIAILAEKDLSPTVEEIRVVNRLDGD